MNALEKSRVSFDGDRGRRAPLYAFVGDVSSAQSERAAATCCQHQPASRRSFCRTARKRTPTQTSMEKRGEKRGGLRAPAPHSLNRTEKNDKRDTLTMVNCYINCTCCRPLFLLLGIRLFFTVSIDPLMFSVFFFSVRFFSFNYL